MEKVSIIITVKNEEHFLPVLLHALEQQTLQPDEVIITDAGSSDTTYVLLEQWHPKFKKVISKVEGNRSVGRNAAIQMSANEIILITDAGCIPEKAWAEYLTHALINKKADLVAGYYKPVVHTAFQEAASCYMLVMPKHVNTENFLPATRSMALRKNVWQALRKFPEDVTHSEDYAFAQRARKLSKRIVFEQRAIVEWIPPKNLQQFLKQIYSFAYCDILAGVSRLKMFSIFARYVLLILAYILQPNFAFVAAILYFIWSIQKNYEYVRKPQAFVVLPFIQVLTDITVMWGSIMGFIATIGRHEN